MHCSKGASEFLNKLGKKFEFIKKLVMAWDPDYTKLTPEEERRLEAAENSGFVNDGDIDWSTIGL